MTELGNHDSLTVEHGPEGAIVVHGDIDVAGGPILEAAIVDCEAAGPIVLDGPDRLRKRIGLRDFMCHAGLSHIFCKAARPRRKVLGITSIAVWARENNSESI